MPKTLKEHITFAEIIKAIIILGAALGITSVKTQEPELQERVTVLEARIDPILTVLEGIQADTRVTREVSMGLKDSLYNLKLDLRVHEAATRR